MSSINSVRKLQILYFRKKNKKIKNLKNGEKMWPDIGIYTYYLKTVCGDDIEIDRVVVVELREKFYINLYGKVGAKAKSLDKVRKIIDNLPKYIPITQMSPTSRAFYFHMLHVYLQINTWKHLRQLLEFDKFGFLKDENGNGTAIITDK